MPGTDPQAVAEAIRNSANADAVMRALLEEYGTSAPWVWDAGVSEYLVMRAGWNAARNPADYVWISPGA